MQKRFLCVWNADKSRTWKDFLKIDEFKENIKSGHDCISKCFVNKTKIQKGEKIYLLHIGPRYQEGIFGSGIALTSSDGVNKEIEIKIEYLFSPATDTILGKDQINEILNKDYFKYRDRDSAIKVKENDKGLMIVKLDDAWLHIVNSNLKAK